ncbi:MAG: iron(III) transport system substrate-binding protein [Alphaproteobacteria bacterium]|nr:iron(III) transport system substrate-binding protein [Alphaproteobacteria bacterium]
MLHRRKSMFFAVAGLFSLLSLALAPAYGQGAPSAVYRPWIDPDLLKAAQAEGSLTVYSSTNEQEGLPLWKIFEDATGLKVNYIRGADGPLMGRIAVEYRTGQYTWDVLQTTTLNKVLPEMLAAFDPSEAKNIIPEARDPGRRWYGVYANYNTPSYNTQHVKASDLPQSYEEFVKHKEWAGKIAIDNSDNEWVKGIMLHYGEEKGTKLIKDIVANLKPVVTDGHLAMARSVGSGEYWVALNQYLMLTMNVKLAGSPTDFWALDPVVLIFGQIGVNLKAPHPNAARLGANFMLSKESQEFLTKFGRIPTRLDVPSNPPDVLETLKKKKIITTLLSPEEEKKWQKTFETLFKDR